MVQEWAAMMMHWIDHGAEILPDEEVGDKVIG